MYHGSLISFFLCLQMVTGTLQARGPDEALVAVLYSFAELPCFLAHHQSIKNIKIIWTRSLPSQVVHLYEDGRDKPEEAMKEYYGRTELEKSVMHKGIVVLKILNVRPSDSGQYHCVFQHGSFYSDTVIELKVAALGSHPQFHVEVTKSSQLRLECKSEGWFPQPKVQWIDSEGGEIPAQSETHTQDNGGLFHVTTSLVLREPSQKNLTCSVWNPVLNQKKEEQLSIAVFGPNRPRDTPSSSLRPLSSFLSSHHLWNHLRDRPTHTGFFSTLIPYCQTTMSSQIRQNYSTEVEDAIDDLASLHLQPPHLPLSGFYFNHDDEALDGVGHFLCELEKKREGSKRLLKLQNQRGGRIHSQDVLKLPKMSGQNSGRPGLGEEPEPGPLGAAGPVGSTRADPHRCDFLQNHFLGEQVKLIEKMSDHLTHFCRLAGPRLGGRVSLRKARPQAQPAAFGALCIPLAFV